MGFANVLCCLRVAASESPLHRHGRCTGCLASASFGRFTLSGGPEEAFTSESIRATSGRVSASRGGAPFWIRWGPARASHARRSCRSSRLQRLDPSIALRACCIPQPILGFTWFWRPSGRSGAVRGDQPHSIPGARRAFLPHVPPTLRSLPPARRPPRGLRDPKIPTPGVSDHPHRCRGFAACFRRLPTSATVHGWPCPLVVGPEAFRLSLTHPVKGGCGQSFRFSSSTSRLFSASRSVASPGCCHPGSARCSLGLFTSLPEGFKVCFSRQRPFRSDA